ncbi:MAG: CheB methylesterase domain-containing protein [Desulfuromonas sp.]|nr:CheB methylesterase domain-containing protein [Desulfuromonas sp.]
MDKKAISALGHSPYRMVVVGSSTGGPTALQLMLRQLPPHFPLPLVVVQHIAPGFIAGLVTWLAKSCALPISIAQLGERIQRGHVYLAPDGVHTGIDKQGCIIFNDDPPVHSVRPAASYLFSSTGVRSGRGVIGVLLTGMGCDGSQELYDLQQNGAVTLLQDESSCVVYGMPGVAAKLGAGDYHLPPDKIGQQLVALVAKG